ncbi:MAG: hypothetical protein PHF74_07005 [Dehalococcoidales bacterium]|nr:hypothetical protein [Dehalococcoidales bacterium]
MPVQQKCACTQLLIFVTVIAGWLVLFISNNTIFFWQNDLMKMAYYLITATGFGLLFFLNLLAIIFIKHGKPFSDERDKIIWKRATLWALGISYTVMVIILLALSIIYMNLGCDTVSVYFPLFIVLTGGVVLLFSQAVAALIMYNRKVIHG